jgi:hypothetical protein
VRIFSSWLLPLLIFSLGIYGCASKSEGISGPEQRKRVEEYRARRQNEISMAGFWQEYLRTESIKRMAEQALSFTDTLKINFREDSTARFFDEFGRISAGRFYNDGNEIHLGNGQSYSNIDRIGDTLVFYKNSKKQYLKKVKGFYTRPIPQKRFDKDDNEVVELNLQFLKGKWKVYKKKDHSFNQSKTYLNSIEIKEENADESYETQAYFSGGGKTVSQIGFLEIKERKINLHLKNSVEHYELLMAQDDEMIWKQAGVVYHLKNLSR